jgi:hypothetical protein
MSQVYARLEKQFKKYEKRFPAITIFAFRYEPKEYPTKRILVQYLVKGSKNLHTVAFGLRGAQTYFDGAPEEKRCSYLARASKIKNAAGRFVYKIAGTPNSFAYWVLWN